MDPKWIQKAQLFHFRVQETSKTIKNAFVAFILALKIKKIIFIHLISNYQNN